MAHKVLGNLDSLLYNCNRLIYVHGTVFFTFLITKTSSDKFGENPLAKLYLEIPSWSPTLNLRSLQFFSLLECNSIESIYVLNLTSTGLILILLWYVLLYSLTMSFNLSIYAFFDIKSCICRF